MKIRNTTVKLIMGIAVIFFIWVCLTMLLFRSCENFLDDGGIEKLGKAVKQIKTEFDKGANE